MICSSVPVYVGFLKVGGGGPGKFENNKDQKISPLRISPFSCPKLGEDPPPKKRSSLKISPAFGPKLDEKQEQKKVFTQN